MSTIIAANISDGTTSVASTYVVNGSAKAFASMDQTTMTLQDSLNVSSLIDVQTGLGQCNFASSMASSQYCLATSCGSYNHAMNRTSSFMNAESYSTGGAAQDANRFGIICMGDLA